MKILLVISLLLYFSREFYCLDLQEASALPPGPYNVISLATSLGYPLQLYTVQTPDGYLLKVPRIPHGKKSSGKPNKPVVLLVHAFLNDAREWMQNNESQSLAFVLADNGYDVWLANIRGNDLGRRNVRLSPDQVEFWDFSFDEIAQYDIPSIIDFVLGKTGQEQLYYIGHSQGTTVGFAMLSERPYYNKKVKFFIALAPVAYVTNTTGILGSLFNFFLDLEPIYKEIGFVELLPRCLLVDLFDYLVCGTPLRFICSSLYFGLSGYDPQQLNNTRLPIYFNIIPAGTSVKDFIHFSQIHLSRKFRKYDYYDRNQEVYNQPTPPEYDLSKITTPIATLSGQNDLVADPTDVARTESELTSLVESYIVPFENFSHFDFVTAIDAYPLVHRKVLSLLKKYGKN